MRWNNTFITYHSYTPKHFLAVYELWNIKPTLTCPDKGFRTIKVMCVALCQVFFEMERSGGMSILHITHSPSLSDVSFHCHNNRKPNPVFIPHRIPHFVIITPHLRKGTVEHRPLFSPPVFFWFRRTSTLSVYHHEDLRDVSMPFSGNEINTHFGFLFVVVAGVGVVESINTLHRRWLCGTDNIGDTSQRNNEYYQ